MIIKSFEIKNFINKKNIFLIYGINEGIKDEIINSFTLEYPKEAIFRYDEKEIFLNLENFYNNLYSQSFFEEKKIILIDDITDKFKNEVELILSKKLIDVTLILISNNLEKKSKIRSLFEKDKELICVPVYKDDNRNLFNIANTFFKSKNIKISPESINLIIERSSEDRKNLKNELNKIESFVGDKKKIDLGELTKLTNLSENYDIGKVIDLSLAKNSKQTMRALNENIFTKEDTIIIIRSFLKKSKRLLKLLSELEETKNIDQVISSTKPPIFWKDKPIVKRQPEKWSKSKINDLITSINKIEIFLKKNSSISLMLVFNFIYEISDNS